MPGAVTADIINIAMKASYNGKRKPNRLLQILICISIGVHAVIFMHVAGIYQSSAIKYIELSLQDISQPFTRSIPRPVHRPKKMDQPEEFKKIRVNPSRIPRIEPTKIDPGDKAVSRNLMAQISLPDLPNDMGTGSDTYHIGEILDTAEFTTAKSYYEMVVLKIESSKKYPESAKAMQKEGRVTVGFVLTLQGNVKDIKIIKSCQHAILDQAARKAVKDAAPFPRPPYRFFKRDIPLELNIIFETT